MKPNALITALAIALLTSTARAAGNHAGGHSEDADAIGQPGQAAKVSRTVTIDMTDSMRFTPSDITVKQGETIKFIVNNAGKIKHEMVLGTEKELKEHDAVMKKNPEMEHADANQITVQPGQSGQIIWQFTKASQVSFACLQPGHFDAGMKGVVNVSGKATANRAEIQATQAAASSDMTDGEIRKVDRENKKITLKHGAIKHLDMPPMTMVFQVEDPAILNQVNVGDLVKFSAEKSGGAIVITDIQPKAPK